MIVASASPQTTQSSAKGAWSGHVNHLNFGGHQLYLWIGWI